LRHLAVARPFFHCRRHLQANARLGIFLTDVRLSLLLPLLAPAQHTMLARLEAFWAYVTLGASAIVTEELAPLVGGFAAEQGHLGFVRAVLATAVGVWVATALLYFVGRWRAAWVRLMMKRSPPVVKRLLRAMRLNPWRSTILARFIFGGRIAVPLACGAAHVRIWIFLTGSAIAAAVWATLFTALGWFFGDGAVLVIGHVRRYEDELAMLLVGLGLAAFFWLRRRQVQKQVQETKANSSEPAELP
jgi:membrane protein DedA with SNARE-associated domain